MFSTRAAIFKAWHISRPLSVLLAFSLICLVMSVIGLAVDHRIINNELAWIKPTKFSISLAMLGATMMWLSQYVRVHQSFFRRICLIATVGTIVELLGIITQVIRGAASHFNTSTAVDHCLYMLILAAITPVAVAMVATFWILLNQKHLPPVVGASLRWAAFISVIGVIPGILMVVPDHVQNFLTHYNQFDGHTIGFDEGGPGLPFIGWSTVAGDLRVAHFLGLHALQILPLVGFLIQRLFPQLQPGRQRALVWNFGFSYLGCVLILSWQALRAESIVSPSALTMHVAILLALASISGFWYALFADPNLKSIFPTTALQEETD